ncbi:hypothetical protein QCA50_004541 [Cerrena zonata]|uniref:P-loop containing nucleoside triphosphate hydrolase protein n=1 Tax=Cerrena zonata TaxID=2478898 RepID=A0AAW0GU57_9APHY
MILCPQDSSFGPASACRSLDFTLYFQQTILSFTPDVILSIFAVVRLAYLHYQTNKLSSIGWAHFGAKVLVLCALFAANGALLKYSVHDADDNTFFIWRAAPIMQFISSVPLGALVVAEHFRSSTPSMLVICYALLKGLFTAAALRTYSKMGLSLGSHPISILTAVCATAYFCLLCIEMIEKRRLLRVKTLPKVSTSNFLSRSLCFWLLPLLWYGRKKTLSIDDCGSIPDDLSAKSSGGRLRRALLNTRKSNSYLTIASFKAFGAQFLEPIIPRAVLLLATFAQPLLVNQALLFVSDVNKSESFGWALFGGFVCVYALLSLATAMYWEKVFDVTVQYRAALVSNIYKKTLTLSSLKSRSLGSGVASTYMSVDVERICQGLEIVHEMWAALASVALAIVILYDQATWPAFLPIAVTLLLMVLAGAVGGKTGARQSEWLAATDKRVKYLTSIVHKFLPIKWSRYEEVIAKRASELRSVEMKKAGAFYMLLANMAGFSGGAATFCVLSVLGPYAIIAKHRQGGALDPRRLFTIVTTVNLLAEPLGILGQLLPTLFAAYASVKRIESYLLLEDKEDVSEEDKDTAEKCEGRESAPIKMLDASFAWTSEAEEPFLKDISVDLAPSKFHICIGTVASGKSLFLLSILRETSMRSGEYNSPHGRIAYASQDALIIPGTVRDNILFGHEYDEGRYRTVLSACALLPDLERMKSGDQTRLGEKGSTVSGGQKQRIALARAVYANASWTLLDDPLSALDAETEVHIFESLFGESGLLKNKSVILVTHNVKYLSSADNLVVLAAGRVEYQGSPTNYELPFDISDTPRPDMDKSGTKQSSPTEHVPEEEEEEAPLQKSSIGWVPYIFFSNMATWTQVGLIVFFVFLGSATQIGIQFYLREWSMSGGQRVGAWIGGYGALSVVSMITVVCLLRQIMMAIVRYAGLNIHKAEINGLFNTAPSYFMTTPVGRIINRFSQDIFLIDFEFPLASMSVLSSFATLLGLVVLIIVPSPYLILVMVPLGVFYYMTLLFYVGTSKKLQHLESASKSPLYTTFSATLSGLECIRALGVESFFENQNDYYLDRSQKPFFFRFGGIRFLRTMLAFISWIVAIGLAALTVGLRDKIDASLLGLALSSLTSLTQTLSVLLMSVAMVENGSVAVSRIHEVVTLPAEPDNALEVTTDSEPKGWPNHGSVQFENVQIRYKPDLPLAVRGVSFNVPAGHKIGICGRSGSGKSSMIMALLRGLDESLISGRVLIDGIDIRTVPLGTLRKSLNLVTQDPFLWAASIRENLDPETAVEEKDLWDALESVGMREAVTALPDKLDSVLEEEGSLSKGQRQLLCLARVLLRKRKVVILDEASSSLDLETDEKMREVIRDKLAGSTVLAVAHRIATIIDFDQIIVMENGMVVESGPPQELLSIPNGRFAALAASQGLVKLESDITDQA